MNLLTCRRNQQVTTRPWHERAKCAGREPTKYEVVVSTVPRVAREQDEYARNLCAGCPVVLDCALDALDYGDVGVIRAGLILRHTSGGVKQDRLTRQKLNHAIMRNAKGR